MERRTSTTLARASVVQVASNQLGVTVHAMRTGEQIDQRERSTFSVKI